MLSRDFPQGGFVGFDGDLAVAMGLGVQVHFDEDNPVHTVHDIMPGMEVRVTYLVGMVLRYLHSC